MKKVDHYLTGKFDNGVGIGLIYVDEGQVNFIKETGKIPKSMLPLKTKDFSELNLKTVTTTIKKLKLNHA